MFEFDFTFGKEQIVAANRVLTFRPRLALLVAVCAVMLEESIRLHSLLLTGLMFAVAGIVIGIFVLLERISLKNSMSALSGSLDQTVHVTLHETGIKVTMSKPGQYDIHNERDWNAIRAVWESEKYYFLFVSQSEFYTLTKKSMVTGTPSDCTQFLKIKIGKKYKRRIAL